ncbi:hypothetical protein RDWZM_005757, partial [Blomia tropicalis]
LKLDNLRIRFESIELANKVVDQLLSWIIHSHSHMTCRMSYVDSCLNTDFNTLANPNTTTHPSGQK